MGAGLACDWQVCGGGVTQGWHWGGRFGAEFSGFRSGGALLCGAEESVAIALAPGARWVDTPLGLEYA